MMEPVDQDRVASPQQDQMTISGRQQGAGSSGSVAASASTSSYQLQAVQRQVDEVVQVMKKNLEGIQQREQNLNELEQRAENLQQSSAQFNTSATQLQRKMWWQNMKWTWIAIGVTAGVLAIIIISLVIKYA